MWSLRPQRVIPHPPKSLELRANLLMMSKSSRVSEKSLLLTALTRVHSRTLHLEKHGHVQRQLIMLTRCFFHITTAAQLLRYPTLIPQKSVLSYTDLIVFDEGIVPLLFASAALGKHSPGYRGADNMHCVLLTLHATWFSTFGFLLCYMKGVRIGRESQMAFACSPFECNGRGRYPPLKEKNEVTTRQLWFSFWKGTGIQKHQGNVVIPPYILAKSAYLCW